MAFKSPVSLQNLILSGQSLRSIEKLSGISHQRLSEYARGIRKPSTEVTNTLSSTWRTFNYNTLRQQGISSYQARQVRDWNYARRESWLSTVEAVKAKIKATATDRYGNPINPDLIDRNVEKSKKDADSWNEYF
jgi:transcriptional regulator with XRE-family HTH domain